MRYLITAITAMIIATATAQTSEDVLRMSQYNYGYTSARVSAMGGAFASLGADLASVNINPAGLGMYRGSEFSISPSLTAIKTKSSYDGASNIASKKTRFALNNMGIAFNLYKGTGALTSITAAVSYNKMADFNANYTSAGASLWSIGDMFVDQLNSANPPIPPSALEAPDSDIYKAFRGQSTNLWNPIMGYQSFLVDYSNNQYIMSGLDAGAVSKPRLNRSTSGSIGEYGIAAGMNFMNILYLGLTLGVQDIYYRNYDSYNESFDNNAGSLSSFNLVQSLRMSGSAINVKVGAIVMPIAGLRIGVSYHTPSYINISEEYYAKMNTYIKSEKPGFSDTPYLLNDYNMNTPSRFLVGVSYAVGSRAIVSADYERVWYNKMKMESDEDYLLESDIDSEVGQLYAPANNLRFGVEVRVLPSLFVRGGYAYYDSMYKNRSGNIGKSQNISGGFGYRTSAFFIDFAYVNIATTLPSYRYYDYLSPIDGVRISSGEITQKIRKNNFILTAGMRF